MSTLMLVAYILGCFLTIVIGALNISFAETTAEIRHASRMILTCWAWPVWAIIGLYKALRYLIANAI
jgi:ABC-type Na+ efflux pump permease subunit